MLIDGALGKGFSSGLHHELSLLRESSFSRPEHRASESQQDGEGKDAGTLTVLRGTVLAKVLYPINYLGEVESATVAFRMHVFYVIKQQTDGM